MGAPIFLFLAGVALALAAGSRLRNGRTAEEAAALARKRGWQIFGLAVRFRLQSWLISGGTPGAASCLPGRNWPLARRRTHAATGTHREHDAAALGPAIALGGYAASFLPPIYAQTSFWTSSPTFFFVRLGILLSLLPVAYGWNALGGRRAGSSRPRVGVEFHERTVLEEERPVPILIPRQASATHIVHAITDLPALVRA